MAVSTKEYYEGVLKQAGVSDVKRQALIAQLEDEEISKALANEQVVPRMRHDEYSRSMDELRKKEQANVEYYNKLVTWEQTEAQRLAANNGNGNGAGDPKFLTVEEANKLRTDFDTRSKQQESQFIGLLKNMGDITSDYVTRFHEKPDLNAIEKIAVDKQVPLMQAYQEYIAPRVQDNASKDFEAKLKAAREEGAKDWASKHKMPVDSQPREYHTLLDQDRKKQVGVDDYKPGTGELSPAAQRTLEGNFVESWNNATARTSGT